MTRRVLRGFNAQRFAEVRRDHQFTVSDLARLADVGQSTVHSWEAGRGTPQVDLLARDAPALRRVRHERVQLVVGLLGHRGGATLARPPETRPVRGGSLPPWPGTW